MTRQRDGNLEEESMYTSTGGLWRGLQDSFNKNPRLLLFLVFISAFAVRAVIMCLNSETVYRGDAVSYLRLGSELAQGKGFIDPKTGLPYAYWPPGWPMVIALIYKMSGQREIFLHIYQAVVSSLLCPAVFLLAESVFSTGIGLLAGLCCIIYPAFLHPQIGFINLLNDPTYHLLLVVGLIFYFRGEKSKKYYFISGLVLGFNALVKPNGLAVPAILLTAALFQFRFSKDLIFISILLSFGFITAVLPWTVRNYLVLNKLVLVSTNSGVNLYVGNATTFTDTSRHGDPFYDRIRAQGDGFSQGQLLNRRGIEFIRNNIMHHPQRFLRKLKYHFDPFVGYKIKNGETMATISKYNWMYVFWVPFTIFGLIIRPTDKYVFLSMLFLLVNVLTALVYLGDVRYRLEIEPLLLITGCMGLSVFVGVSPIRLRLVLVWLLINAITGYFFAVEFPKFLMDLVPGADFG